MPGFGQTDFAWLGSSLQAYKGSQLHGSKKALPGELFCEYAREYAASLSWDSFAGGLTQLRVRLQSWACPKSVAPASPALGAKKPEYTSRG